MTQESRMNDELNMAARHRHGRAWEPVPLTEQQWDWKTALCWLAILAGLAVFFAGLIWWARMAMFAVAVVAG